MMLGNLSEISPVEGHENERSEIDTASAGLQENVNTLVEEFRSLLNSNCRGNSEITEETVRTINKELSSQISTKLDEVKRGLDSQILTAITTHCNYLKGNSRPAKKYRDLTHLKEC